MLALAALFHAIAPAQAAAPSFDCAKAATPAEHAICADPGLAQLDAELAAAWKAASRVMMLDHAALVAQERAWVAARDPQTDPVAIRAAYTSRIAELRELAARAPGTDARATGRYLRDDSRLDVLVRADGTVAYQLVALWHGADPANVHIGAQEGSDLDCGFGANVSASGTWSRVDRRPPLLAPREMY